MINTKALFIGPYGENKDEFNKNVCSILEDVVQWRRNFHPFDPRLVSALEKRDDTFLSTQDLVTEKLDYLLSEMKQSVPFHSPRFLGHMHSDLAIPALLGYITGLLYNQNNVVGESSPISTRKEIEFAAKMCKMIGFEPFSVHPSNEKLQSWGHICSGGTTANIEAVWVARNLKYYPISLKLLVEKIEIQSVDVLENEEIQNKLNEINVSERNLKSYTYKELFNLSPGSIVKLYQDVTEELTKGLSEEHASKLLTEYNNIFTKYDVRSLGVAGIHQAIPDERLEFPKLLVSDTGHYSWDKCLDIVGIGNNNVRRLPVDDDFKLDLAEFENYLQDNLETPVLMVVGVVGTTEESAIDPIYGITNLMIKYEKGHYFHIDGAYGGYFLSCLRDSDSVQENKTFDEKYYSYFSPLIADLSAVKHADSITIDPHKLGYIPYAAGSVFYKNTFYKNFIFKSAPYLAQSASIDALEKTYLGGWTLEGSRSGAAALACALTTEVIPLDKSGYGVILAKTIAQAATFNSFLESYSDGFIKIVPIYKPQTNIVCYAISAPGFITKPEYVNLLTMAITNQMTVMPERVLQNYQFVVSKTELAYKKYRSQLNKVFSKLNLESDSVSEKFELEFIRTVIMHPNIEDYEVSSWHNRANRRVPLYEALTDEIGKIAKSALPKVLLQIIAKERQGKRISILWIENKNSYQKHQSDLLLDKIQAIPEIGKYLDITFYNFTGEFKGETGTEAIKELVANREFDFSVIDLNLVDNDHIEWESGIKVIDTLYKERGVNKTAGIPILYSKFFDDEKTKQALISFFSRYDKLFPNPDLQFLGKQAEQGKDDAEKEEADSLLVMIKSIFKLLQNIDSGYGE